MLCPQITYQNNIIWYFAGIKQTEQIQVDYLDDEITLCGLY